jgi:hypothetical protein
LRWRPATRRHENLEEVPHVQGWFPLSCGQGFPGATRYLAEAERCVGERADTPVGSCRVPHPHLSQFSVELSPGDQELACLKPGSICGAFLEGAWQRWRGVVALTWLVARCVWQRVQSLWQEYQEIARQEMGKENGQLALVSQKLSVFLDSFQIAYRDFKESGRGTRPAPPQRATSRGFVAGLGIGGGERD